MWHPLATHRAHDQHKEHESLAEQYRLARALPRSYAFARARAEHPELFAQPRGPALPDAA